MTVVLDTWALVAHLRDEPAGERVREAWLGEGAAMCSINMGEALHLELRARGARETGSAVEAARRDLDCVDPDWPLVRAAAAVKAVGGLSYADAFCVATAERLGAPLMTGDREIVAWVKERGGEVIDLRREDG